MCQFADVLKTGIILSKEGYSCMCLDMLEEHVCMLYMFQWDDCVLQAKWCSGYCPVVLCICLHGNSLSAVAALYISFCRYKIIVLPVN